MGVATTTDTTDSVHTSFEMLKDLHGMPVQVVETIKKEKRGKVCDLNKNNEINPKIMLYFEQSCVVYLVTISLFQHFCNYMKHWMDVE